MSETSALGAPETLIRMRAAVRPIIGLLLPVLFILGAAVTQAYAIPVGTRIDNSFRIEFSRVINGDTIAFTNTSNTVTVAVELASNVDVLNTLDTQFMRADSTAVFIKRIQNLANGTDTFTLKADSTFGSVIGFFIDANADSKLDTAIDPAVSQIVLAEGAETTVLVQVRPTAGIPDKSTDTISIGAHSKGDTALPASDTAQLVLTMDAAPPTEVILRSPSDSATLKTTAPTLQWDTTTDTGSGLAAYKVEISDISDTDFTDTVRGVYLSDTKWVVTPALPKGTYRWHIRAIDNIGNVSAGADTRIFAVDTTFTISLSSPADDSTTTDSTPTFTWTGDGETFLIHISRDSAFTQTIETSTGLTAKTYTSAGLGDSVYYWRVAGVDSAGLSGTSTIRKLTVSSPDLTAPTEVTLVSPADSSAAGTAPKLIWSKASDSSSGVAFYIVEISTYADTDFTDTVRTASVYDTTWTVTPALTAGSYRWHVKAKDTAGNINSGTDSRSFTVDTSAGQLRVTLSDTQPSILTAQEMDTPAVAVFALAADTKESVTISRVRVTHVGGMPASKVSGVLVYRDAGTAAALDSSDTLFASGTLTGGAADLTGTAFNISAGDTALLLVLYQTSSGLTNGETFLVQIAASSDVSGTGAISNLTPQVTGTPASGKTFTVRARYPAVSSVSPADSTFFLPPQDETGILPIRIKFNIPIDTSNIDTNTVRLVDDSGTNRTDTVTVVDSRTLQIKATYADTQWPYGTKFEIRIGVGIKDLDAPADSMQEQKIFRFETLKNSQAEQTVVASDGKAQLKIDSGDISPTVKGIVVTVDPPPTISDALLTQALNAVKGNPFLELLPNSLAVYDYKVKKRDPNDTSALVKLEESDFLNPVDVLISVNKPVDYLESKGTPLNFRMIRMGHFNESTGEWEIMENATLEDNGGIVTIKAPTKKFSLFGAFFAFAPNTVKETFRTYPNPADPFTVYGPNASGVTWQGFKFGFQMPKAGSLTIRIYDFAGQLVRVLGPYSNLAANYNAFADAAGPTWDGKNGRGQTVLNGAYFVFAEIRYTDGSIETATDRIAVVK